MLVALLLLGMAQQLKASTTPVKPLSAHDFLTRVTPKLLEYVDGQSDASQKTLEFKGPQELSQIFNDVGVPLELGSEAADPEKLLAACDAVMQYGVKTCNPLFNNQLFGAADPVAIAGDWMSTCAHTSSYTFEVAPVFSMMETELIVKLGSMVGGGFADRSKVDGLFVPGGSLSNLYALQVARYRACPAVKTKGNAACPGLCAFVSDESHYSYKKSCSLLGLGSDNLYRVPSDPSTGAMDPEALRTMLADAVAKGERPFFVGCTAGTTVLGAFDPFADVRAVIDEFNAAQTAKQGGEASIEDGHPGVWMHVDGAWGGSAIFSEREKTKWMKGVEGADSFCTNPHKMMGCTLQCCCFMTRHPNLLMAANGANAAYLFQPDKENTELDYGDKTIQCGRKVDTLKFWLMWKFLGDEGMEKRVDHLVDLADYMSARIKDTRDEEGRRCFVQVAATSCTNVVFYAIPPSLRPDASKVDSKDDAAVLAALDFDALSKVAPAVKSQMQRRGLALIGFQPVKTFPNCWRMVFAGAKEASMTTSTVDDILDSMKDLAEELFG